MELNLFPPLTKPIFNTLFPKDDVITGNAFRPLLLLVVFRLKWQEADDMVEGVNLVPVQCFQSLTSSEHAVKGRRVCTLFPETHLVISALASVAAKPR